MGGLLFARSANLTVVARIDLWKPGRGMESRARHVAVIRGSPQPRDTLEVWWVCLGGSNRWEADGGLSGAVGRRGGSELRNVAPLSSASVAYCAGLVKPTSIVNGPKSLSKEIHTGTTLDG